MLFPFFSLHQNQCRNGCEVALCVVKVYTRIFNNRLAKCLNSQNVIVVAQLENMSLS